MIDRAVRDTLGEGPLWRSGRAELCWVDIVGQALNRLDDRSGAVRRQAVAEPIGWVVEHAGDGLLAGFRSGIAALDDASGETDFWCAPEPDRPQNRLNDAKVDGAGRLWFGSKDDSDQQASGAFYRMAGDRRPQRVDDGYHVANGPAFSPDGRSLYHTDSGLRTIYRFALAADGSLGPRAEFLRFEDDWGYPDGMTVDAEGCLWVAHWDGGAISRFDPSGTRIASITLPARNVTSCAFGGAALDRLYVTTAAMASPDTVADGALFVLEPGVRGLPATPFAG